jgi:hypothetical protein
MIQHILLWNYRDSVSEEERSRLEAELMALPGKVPSLRRLSWGPVVGGRNQSFSHCFVMLFDDVQGLQQYATHPDHLHFSGPFKEACAAQVVADFEERGE